MIELRIKELAKEKGVTLNELARAAGVTQPSISRIVNGNIMPAWKTLEKIANHLNVAAYELFSDAPRNKEPVNTLVCPHCDKPINIEIK